MSSDFLSVELIDSMGDDLTVVNAARVSFGKRVSEFDDLKDGKLISRTQIYIHQNGKKLGLKGQVDQ